ncbi:MAG: GNAT family N-acetyltransferase, partial [Eggerthellaceae bacterium]|nr:GNAT family N-acetyltransferase [Eggerthellaceae bacterium]
GFFGEGPLVRRAIEADLDTLAAFAAALWPEDDPSELRSEFMRLLPSPEAALFVVEHSGGPVGFAQSQLRHDYVEGCSTSPVGYLEGIYTAPEARRHGCGRALVTACEAWARGKGCTEFASDCELDNDVSAAFHAALGFAEANRIVCFAKNL